MPRSREGGTRGFGFLTFSTAAEAEEAADRIDGMDVDGRRAKANIARARPPRPGDFGGRGGGGGRSAAGPSPKIYVGNLPMDTSEADLEDLYRDYGPIRCVVSPCLTRCPARQKLLPKCVCYVCAFRLSQNFGVILFLGSPK